MQTEIQARDESFLVLQECINKEFPLVEQEISQEVNDREKEDEQNQKELVDSLQELEGELEQHRSEREQQEVEMVETFKDILK